MRTVLTVVLCLVQAVWGRVVFLVLEGLTDSLMTRIPTPALDKVIAAGALFPLRPEFPAETLPTLQAMLTGFHSETSGVNGDEVYSMGHTYKPSDMQYWLYNPNISTITELNGYVKKGRTGIINIPGSQFYAKQDTIYHWGTVYQIVEEEKPTSTRRTSRGKRSAKDEELTNQKAKDSEEIVASKPNKSNAASSSKEKEAGSSGVPERDGARNASDTVGEEVPRSKETDHKYYFNKTMDTEWQEWMGKVESVAEWLADTSPVNLVLFKLEQPGQAIRQFGPGSLQAEQAVHKADQLVGELMSLLERRGELDTTNIIITGLHGFVDVSAESAVDISNLADSKDYSIYGTNPVLNLEPDQEKELEVFAALMRGAMDKFVLYDKHHIPEELHYGKCERVTPIVLLAKEGFVFAQPFFKEVKEINIRANRSSLLSNKYGMAGYDNALESMQSFLVMRGPGVTRPNVHPDHTVTIHAVDVFPLLAHFIGLSPPASNGSLVVFRDYLAHPPSHTVQYIKNAIDYIQQKEVLPTASILLGLTVLLLLLVCCCCCCRYRRTKDFSQTHNYRYSQVTYTRVPELPDTVIQ